VVQRETLRHKYGIPISLPCPTFPRLRGREREGNRAPRSTAHHFVLRCDRDTGSSNEKKNAPMPRLKGKVAIVAGAGSIAPGWSNGKATAVLFAREGAKVFAVDRDLAAAQ
jgi:hypothetical protein